MVVLHLVAIIGRKVRSILLQKGGGDLVMENFTDGLVTVKLQYIFLII